jgi:hypothetical protein
MSANHYALQFPAYSFLAVLLKYLKCQQYSRHQNVLSAEDISRIKNRHILPFTWDYSTPKSQTLIKLYPKMYYYCILTAMKNQ